MYLSYDVQIEQLKAERLDKELMEADLTQKYININRLQKMLMDIDKRTFVQLDE